MRTSLLVFFLLPIVIIAQPAGSSKPLATSANLFSYRDYSSDRTLTEVNIYISQSQFYSLPELQRDSLDIIAEVFAGDEMVSRGWHLLPLVTYLADSLRESFLDQFVFALEPGTYRIKITVQNRNNRLRLLGDLRDEFTVEDYRGRNVSASSMLISDLMKQADGTEERFVRYGMYIQPYPLGLFSKSKMVMFYLAEFYGLNAASRDDYKLRLEIFSGNGSLVKTIADAELRWLEDRAIVIGGQNVMALSGGSYLLSATVYDGALRIAKTTGVFDVLSKKSEKAMQAASVVQINPEYHGMTEAEIDDEVYVIKYIVPENTYNRFENADLRTKKILLTSFWDANDYQKETPENEFRSMYKELVVYVRSEYSERGQDGVDTDMGRITLLYGRPDEVNRRVDDDLAGQTVELWRYLNHQAIFLFVQEDFIGSLRLVHSTMRGELSDPDWEEYLRNNPDLLTD
jgi:GWxTD domain-containing protein